MVIIERVNMEGLISRVKSKKKKFFQISKSIINLDAILNQCLPDKDECIKLISFDGSFSSIEFISLVAMKETIIELTASTLRVGGKQAETLVALNDAGKLLKASFYIGSIMKEDIKQKIKKYDYYTNFLQVCGNNNWDLVVINNHSKTILMQTEYNYYVLETSSNLNENPKIEQYSFENNKELYDFYYKFFDILKTRIRILGNR